jgi:2-dehydropantoate 2-reductase
MKITIIGSGAMGCLFGGLLTEAGQEVQLVDVWPEHVKALNENGLSISRDNRQRTIPVQASCQPESTGRADLILIFVKHGQTAVAAKTAARLLTDSGMVLTLQNGMGNAEIIAEIIGKERLLCGTTAQGAMLLEPGKIQHSGIGKTVIGMWNSLPRPMVAQVATLFSKAGIATDSEEDILPILWNKLFANVGINAITALTNIRNGQLLDLKESRQLMEEVVQEALSVARALRIPVADDALDNVSAIALATAPNRSSMGQDVDARRITEIDAINGYIVRRAEELGIRVPVNRTLVSLIKTLQAHYSH